MAIHRIQATPRPTPRATHRPPAHRAAPPPADARRQLAAALARVAALEGRVAELQARQAATEQVTLGLREAREKGDVERRVAERAAARRRVDEAMRPTMRRTVLELVEVGLRVIPVVNALAALVRIGRLGWAAIDPVRRRELDWREEWTRLAIDVAGVAGAVLLPGVGGALGAAGTLAANLTYTDPANEGLGLRGGSSQLLGGLNLPFDDYPVRNGLRERLGEAWDHVSGKASEALLTGRPSGT